MILLEQFKNYARNIFFLKAVSIKQALKQIYQFPIDYHLRNNKSSFPLNILLFLTLRCNAKCKMCNLNEILNKHSEEFSLKQFKKFIDSVKKYKPSIILFGGEPTIRKDFIDILRIIKQNKMSCGLFTNALALNEDMIKKMISLKLDYIVFSLQGNEQIHDFILNLKGAYKKMIENIKIFRKLRKNTRIVINTTITEHNINYLEDIIKIGEELKVDLVRLAHPEFFTDSDTKKHNEFMKYNFQGENISRLNYPYNPKNSDIFVKNIIKIKNIKKRKVRFSFTPELSDEELKSWYDSNFKTKRKCYFVWRSLFIFPNGDAYPCGSFHYKMGNVFKENLSDIWNNSKYINLRKKLKKGIFPACARCCKL